MNVNSPAAISDGVSCGSDDAKQDTQRFGAQTSAGFGEAAVDPSSDPRLSEHRKTDTSCRCERRATPASRVATTVRAEDERRAGPHAPEFLIHRNRKMKATVPTSGGSTRGKAARVAKTLRPGKE